MLRDLAAEAVREAQRERKRRRLEPAVGPARPPRATAALDLGACHEA